VDGLLILAIETATGCGSVSLSRSKEGDFHLLAECTSQPDMTHSRRLLGTIEWLMGSVGTKWDDLDAIAISTGPGSFTGLRIGMAAAKSIVMATNARLVGIPTLDALACCTGRKNCLICSLLDARKKQVYACFYRTDEKGLPHQLAEPVVIDPHVLLDKVNEPIVFVGPGAKTYSNVFATCRQGEILPDYSVLPRAMYVGLLGGYKIEKGEFLEPVTATPEYVRVPEAEENLKRKLLNEAEKRK
jgi:tRNA threonylcarbamoyladenosine biosynthesis protein TsaB